MEPFQKSFGQTLYFEAEKGTARVNNSSHGRRKGGICQVKTQLKVQGGAGKTRRRAAWTRQEKKNYSLSCQRGDP